ncbi:MAG TPA: hypothetical protein PKC23_04730 [Candidatus Desulfobacillus sp.]|nr:hypothetical protein [Candidatus Desulfobacillus sp.]
MFETGIEKTIITTAIVLWFALGWYLNERLKHVHEKLDRVLEAFDGLRDYLYEIDPQFDDERKVYQALEEGDIFAGMEHLELTERKEQEGKRTLHTPFVR